MVCFPDSSVGKESACNAGDPGLIPGSGRYPAEGIGYPLQCSWASLVALLVKNQPPTWETWVRSLSWEDPLEKGKATQSSILAWRIPWTKSMGSQRVRHNWATFTLGMVCGSRSRYPFVVKDKHLWNNWGIRLMALGEFVCLFVFPVLLTSQPVHVQVHHLLMYWNPLIGKSSRICSLYLQMSTSLN